MNFLGKDGQTRVSQSKALVHNGYLWLITTSGAQKPPWHLPVGLPLSILEVLDVIAYTADRSFLIRTIGMARAVHYVKAG
jgi:hypothetical protein